jgi:glycosidase
MKWGPWVLEVIAGLHLDYMTDFSHLNQTTGAAGFRLDAIKHIDRLFLRDFVGNIYLLSSAYTQCTQIRETKRYLGRPDLFTVGG